MKEVNFNNKNYNIPTEWNDVTVRMLINSAELAEILEDAPIIAIISSYTGIPVKELKVTKANEVNEIISLMEFLHKPYKPTPDNEFLFKGVKYACDDEIVNQQFQDWVSIQTALHNHREKPESALPKLIAILCKKDGETLDDFDLGERTDMFYELPMTKAKDVEAFFLTMLNAYKSITQLSSMIKEPEKLVSNKVKELQDTLKMWKGRDGTSFGMKCVIGTYQFYLWWAEKVLVKSFSSSPTKPLKKTWKQTFKKSLMRLRGKKADNN